MAPIYDFRNNETGEELIDVIMTITEKEQYLKDNPHIEPLFMEGAKIGDPVRLGVRKIDGGMKEVLQQIHERTPGSQLGSLTKF